MEDIPGFSKVVGSDSGLAIRLSVADVAPSVGNRAQKPTSNTPRIRRTTISLPREVRYRKRLAKSSLPPMPFPTLSAGVSRRRGMALGSARGVALTGRPV